jgi:streptogramin lyase
MFVDAAGILWLGTRRGLVEFNPKEGTSFTYLFLPMDPINHITSISQDVVSGRLWLATTDGLFSFDKRSKTFTRYNDEAHCVLSERSGTLWIGTSTGIKKLNRTKQPFTKYSTKEIICAIVNGTEGTLWMYYYPFGWKKFDIHQEQFIPYSVAGEYLYYVWNSGSDMSIRTKGGGVYIQDTLGNVTFSLDSSWRDYLNYPSIGWKTSKGYWAGLLSGDLDLWELNTNRVLNVKNFKQNVYLIYEDRYRLLWIATYMDRLFCFDPGQDSVIEFVSETTNPEAITGRQINQIHEDRKGRLWFATIAGLNRLDRSTHRFVHFTERDGLPTNNIRGILEDDHGFLWLNTTKGISKFDPETGHFNNYDISYGVEPVSDIFFGSGCRTRNGEMYFAGAKGFTRFHPDSIRDNPFIPPIVITSFKKFDRPHPFSHEMQLPYDENFISFEFAALSYISPERNQYAYKMEGLDRDWVYSGTRRFASYPGLEPGEYIFRVKGSNNDGVWNEAGTSISIVIAPPWWKSTAAYALYSIVLLSMVYLTWKMQVKRIRMVHEFEMSKFEAAKLHEVDEMKSRFFANISHEFRTPLTLILGPVKQIMERTTEEETRDDLTVVHKNARRLLALVNQLLDISTLESGSMRLQTAAQNIIPLLKALVLSFASYAERKRITLTFHSRDDEMVAYVDRDKVEKIMTNILSNAFKFTPEGGSVTVAVAKEDRFVNVSISDSGIGIPVDEIPKIFDRFYQVDGSHTREQEGTGIGLSLTKELVYRNAEAIAAPCRR